MRWSVVICALAACGRSGFDPVGAYHKQIVIDHTQVVGGPLVDFPVLVNIVDPELAATAQPDASDIAFVDSNVLSHELESYDSTTGSLVVWVKVPTVSSTADTTFDVVTQAPANNSSDVWSNNFVAVWHMSDDPSGTAPQIHDSTTNAVHGTTSGAMTSDQNVAGQIGSALSFDGIDDNVDLGAASALAIGSGSFTLSMWVYVSTPAGQFDAPFRKGGAAASCSGYDVELGDALWTAHASDGGTSLTATFSMSPILNRWVHLAAVGDRSGQFAAFVDGQPAGSASMTSLGSVTSASPANIGGKGDACDNSAFFAGQIDEVRVASVARTAGWLATEHADQSSPATFARLVFAP